MLRRAFCAFILSGFLLGGIGIAHQAAGQDDKILERGEQLLQDAKSAYEDARTKSSVAAFVDAGFKLEEARIKFIVLQEIGSPDRQKIATDRLRAINQLSKLIHDGKVAITGSPAGPAETPAPKEPEPGAGAPEKAPTPPPEPKAPVDVTRRNPVPDAAKQREAEKLVKELFKEQYAKKSPTDRKALARLLLEQAAKSQDDLAAQWVLYREAQDAAIQACDVRGVVDAIDATSHVYDVDALAMKTSAFATLGKTAKTPEECGSLAAGLLALVDDLIAADLYDSADKAAIAALQHSRKSSDPALLARATTSGKVISEAKSLYQSMKSILETLAKMPDDPAANLEMGKFLCFVKGNWDLGMRFLVKGSDITLKSLAEKELSPTLLSPDRISLADSWWDLSEKEKSPLRKSQMVAHCRILYETALPDATNLVRLKIEKRLGELGPGPTPGNAIDLLALIDPKRDKVFGSWEMKGKALVSATGAQIQIPYVPPDEYDLTMVVEQKQHTESVTGLYAFGTQFAVVIHAHDTEVSGIDQISGRGWGDNETTIHKNIFEDNKPKTLKFSVRKSNFSLWVDGNKVMEWKNADYGHVSLWSGFAVPNAKALFLIERAPGVTISKMVLTSISGTGRKLY